MTEPLAGRVAGAELTWGEKHTLFFAGAVVVAATRRRMETKIQVPAQQESTSIVERVARVISNVRGVKSDYTNLAAELAPIIPFDIFGIVLLRHDRETVRVTTCQREEGTRLWVARYLRLRTTPEATGYTSNWSSWKAIPTGWMARLPEVEMR